jgi:putative ABC transport system permease protein
MSFLEMRRVSKVYGQGQTQVKALSEVNLSVNEGALVAMSVGLIRSETASDLRTLAATGASSRARRAITATTAGAMALLGAVLGTVTGYVGVAGWVRSNSLAGGLSSLGNVPVANLLVILVGMPLAAVVLGWLLSGREPPAIAHQPLE